MSQNIHQVFVANPITSNVGTDLMYFGQSPYTAGDDAAMTYTNFAAQFVQKDAHGNISANNFLSGYATTATAAAVTTLTVASKYQQFFTGSTTQTVVLPVASTLVLGQSFLIVNNSTGVVTVESSGTNTVQAMAAGTSLLVTCILASGTTAASWNALYFTTSGANNNITSMTGLTGYLAAPLGFKDSSGNIGFMMQYAASAVNYPILFNSATGSAVGLEATGSDSFVDIALVTKNGVLILEDGTETIGARMRFFNAAGTFYTGIGCAAAQGASYDATLPGADGAASTSLITNGSGVWSFLTKPSFTSINIQRVTATGAGTYTPTTGMKFVIVQAQAGGGGGGGAATASATQFAIASGGGGGEYIEALFTAANIGTSKAFVVGAGGAGGNAGNNVGTVGSNTTFNSTWIVATGGGAGVGGASAAAAQVFQTAGGSGTGGSVATGTLVKQVPGGNYSAGFAFTTQGIASTGGTSANSSVAVGTGAVIATTVAGVNGVASTGGGGSGAATYNGGTQQAGGNGAAGFINFIEFINV